jgi:hypothetical protein
MAINRISGDILESNLIRSSDLAFNTNLLYVDVANGRIGVKTDSPGNFALDVNGDTRVQGNQTITGDLTVQGTTTTIDSQQLVVEDNIMCHGRWYNDQQDGREQRIVHLGRDPRQI